MNQRETTKGAVFLRSDGSATPVFPMQGGVFSDEEAQSMVGGYFLNTIELPGKCVLVTNDSGDSRELPINIHATEIARCVGAIGASEWIFGDAFLCPCELIER